MANYLKRKLSRPPVKRGSSLSERIRDSAGDDRGRTKPKPSSVQIPLIDQVRNAIRPYIVSTEKSLRFPKVRASTARTRTTFYVGSRGPHEGHDEHTPPDELSIVVYLDTDDESAIARTLKRIDALRQLAGYGPEADVNVRRGSIFRRSRAAVSRVFSPREVKDRLVKLERALELTVIDNRQAEYDNTEADAVQKLLESLQDIPRACMRVGSIFVVKYQSGGESVILVRNLSQMEIRALERFPEIQAHPEHAFSSLATAVESMDEVRAKNDSVHLQRAAEEI
ncbi:hypothetical protein [Micromonospora andamanensis]|uniref:hypothetical protein n=1 Tax=Micromonospora andamanensis TaxID=1287068 RepID=UPI00194F2639|nr:hypothetical protein [Micromonospora andamanensis]GIJ42996.1 hypothetical protein Vwe01_63210 [Micromonospora andamanensis]